ncbi:MAG TPA: hypothetical protein VHT03_01610 [Rhizomicrobium sp.]|jgi:hypothetical protein|nr:hypothetical protein [Rhizomicrobium sp.]
MTAPVVDRTTKIILAAIAIGLWANVFAPVIRPARAQDETSTFISQIATDFHIVAIGNCRNKKLC